ncbi:hypothetical protein BG011_010061 [Mortierella polycephala]|uniref:Alcohol dehydrogenase-like C-terminal domain-containing protein n=1 Tax=Mortierella polycephala TaxID=41804 RepID=A0A9P6QBZ8_9FUNG|nr:hypothetical protein BG011_010061 [Mortierella polycephala]
MALLLGATALAEAAAVRHENISKSKSKSEKHNPHALDASKERFSSCGNPYWDVFHLESITSNRHLRSDCKAFFIIIIIIIIILGDAGSNEKVAYLLNDLKFDAAFNYKAPGTTILRSLKLHAPKGIDIYYENMGGETFEAALDCMNLNGRIIVSGMISQYNTATPYRVRNLAHLISKRLTMRGFVIGDLAEEYEADFDKDVTEWLETDQILYREDDAMGIESAPQAFIGMLKGKNFDKQIVKIADQ